MVMVMATARTESEKHSLHCEWKLNTFPDCKETSSG